jgi:hypothetical protein
MEITTVTTRVTWPGPHSSVTSDRIATMVNEMTTAGKLISRSSPDLDSDSEHTVIAVWSDLAAANEYLAIINTLGPVSAEII